MPGPARTRRLISPFAMDYGMTTFVAIALTLAARRWPVTIYPQPKRKWRAARKPSLRGLANQFGGGSVAPDYGRVIGRLFGNGIGPVIGCSSLPIDARISGARLRIALAASR